MERIDTTVSIAINSDNINIYDENIFRDTDSINCFDCSFIYNKDGGFYHPVEGSVNILGVEIPIKELSFNEMIQLFNGYKIELLYYKFVTYEHLDDIIDCISYEKRIDYIGTLEFLEKKDFVKMKESKSFLATDPRVFSFTEDDIQEWWEVDILGTLFGKLQTDKIIDKYNKYDREFSI